jgi:WD40 repeat protein
VSLALELRSADESPLVGAELCDAVLAHPPASGDSPSDERFGSLQHFAEIWSVCMSPSGCFVATCSEDQSTRLWCLARTSGGWRLAAAGALPDKHDLAVTCVDWKSVRAPRGWACDGGPGALVDVLATCSDDRLLRLYVTAEDGAVAVRLVATLRTHVPLAFETLTYLALEPSGDRVAFGTENGFLIVDALDRDAMGDAAAGAGAVDGAVAAGDERVPRHVFCSKIHRGSLEGLRWWRAGDGRRSFVASCGGECAVSIATMGEDPA